MKFLIVLVLICVSFAASSQKLKFKIDGLEDTTVHLIRYFGKGLFYADTAFVKNEIAEFDGSKQKAGILALFLPDQKMLEFIYNEEDVFIEASLPDMMGTAKVKKSEENKVFHAYVKYMNQQRNDANRFVEQRKGHPIDSENYNKLTDQIAQTTKNVVGYQNELVKNNEGMLVSKIIKMSTDIEIPEAPTNEAGDIIDSNFKFFYYREHYFDNIDFSDDRLVRTPIYHNKLEQYFSKQMMIQHWDTILYYAFDLCDRLDPKSDIFQYTVSWITSNYEKSKIMGMDKVFVMMGNKYFCPRDENGKSQAHWMKEENLKKLCDKVKTNLNLVIGSRPPNIRLRDTSDVTWKGFYSLNSDYTILYFWDPNCGHCKKITPKLQTLYEKKFRERNIEIFAVGKAVGEEFHKWKEYIHENNLEFINVALTDKLYKDATEDARRFIPEYTTLESLNYQQTYDIFATPKVFILDKDKKIIAKSLSISQLEDLMDRLQKVPNSEKLFPPEEDPEDEQMH